jgi:peptidyl-dipeptidase Dcp
MQYSKFTILFASLVFTMQACNTSKNNESQSMMSENPMLQEWTGPYQGVPAFDKMNVADVKAPF